ncbi:hypothetical protein B0T21DRAFT_430952, partial [Apiosordaria backusii]
IPRVPVSAGGCLLVAWCRRLFAFPEPGASSRRCSRIGIAFATAAAQAVARSLRLWFFCCCCSLSAVLCPAVAARFGWTQHLPRPAAPHASSRAQQHQPESVCPCPVLTHCTHTLSAIPDHRDATDLLHRDKSLPCDSASLFHHFPLNGTCFYRIT